MSEAKQGEDSEPKPEANAADEGGGSSGGPEAGRRTFLKAGAGALGAGLAGLVLVPAGKLVLWPLGEDVEVTAGGEDFVVVGKRKQFGAEPVKVDVYADRVDAWNRTKNVKIGSAWVVEREGELVAYSTVCPHLGCAVDFDGEAGKFKCPCHDSAFALDGTPEEGPALRPLDRLELEQRGDEGKLVAIRYARFKLDTEDKVKV